MSDETSKDEPKPIHLWVNGIVAARNQQPYVQIATDKGMVAQLNVAEARSVAHDILEAAHNAEADAMIVRFFQQLDLPPGAVGAFMQQFREFRYQNEQQKVDTARSDPDSGETFDGPPRR